MNPVLRSGLVDATIGASTGGAVGGGLAYAQTGDLDSALNGFGTGFATGAVSGFGVGAGRKVYDHWLNNKHWWTGEIEPPQTQQNTLNTRFVVGEDGVIYDVQPTLDRIKGGGRYPHRNDGAVFQNRENLLPAKPEGTYKEYVMPTPGKNGSGPMRIVTDGTNVWFTPDHYRTFIQIRD